VYKSLLFILTLCIISTPFLASAYVFEKSFLQPGLKNSHVSALQQTLKDGGFYTYPEITGYFGPVTQKAVESFQKAKGITPGPIGTSTVYVLNGTSTGNSAVISIFTRDLKVGMTGHDVKDLQRFLNAHGFEVAKSGPGSLGKETTFFGAGTRIALAKFQTFKKIVPAAGFFGPTTRANMAPPFSNTFTVSSSTGNSTQIDPGVKNSSAAVLESSKPESPNSLRVSTDGYRVDISWGKTNGYVSHYSIKRRQQNLGSEPVVIASTTDTQFSDTNVVHGNIYHYTVTAVHISGESLPSGEVSIYVSAGGSSSSDTTGPVISSVASSTTQITATVTWTTDESSDSRVHYGTSSGVYLTSTTSATLVTSHSVGLTNLSPSTQYYYVVVSADATGNISTSTEKTLLTASFVGLLDTYDNLYAVHSAARVLASYSGPLYILRRSSDNATTSVSAVAGSEWPSTATISSWLGGATGYITTIYDQTGNSRHATQVTNGNQPTINLSQVNPMFNFIATSSQYFSVQSAGGFAQNQAAVSLVAVKKHTSTGAQIPVFVSNGASAGSSRAALGLATGPISQAVGRRLDADAFGATTGVVAHTSWATEIARFDYANADLFHQVDQLAESNTSFQTAGNTSNTASLAVRIGATGAPTQYFDGQMTLVAFVQDLLTTQEASDLVEDLSYLKNETASTSLQHVTTVTTGAGPYAYTASRVPHQRKSFYVDGRYWLFWGDYSVGGSGPFNLKYRSSADGISWTADTTLTTFPLADVQWSLMYDEVNHKLHVVKNIQTGAVFHDGLQYRRGTPNSDGTITWDATWQTVIATGNNVGDYSLAFDTSGNAWVGYADNNSDSPTKGNAKAIKNSATDGTWSTAAGFPATIRAGVADDAFAELSPLSGGAMQATTYEWAIDAVSNSYTVSATGTVVSEGAVTSQSVEANAGIGAKVGRVESVSRNNVVHLAYTRSGGSEIRYVRRSTGGAWGTDVVLATGTSDEVVSSPRIAFDGASNIVVMWSNSSSELWMVKSTDDGVTWGSPIRFQNGIYLEPTYAHLMPAEYADENGLLQIIYLTNTYQLRHGLLNIR